MVRRRQLSTSRLFVKRIPDGPLGKLVVWRPSRGLLVPTRRGGSLGPLLVGMIAWRAVELGCSGIVAGTFPEIADWYVRLGAEQRCLKGWNHEKGLVPIVFGRDL